jgi:hypothetical protein
LAQYSNTPSLRGAGFEDEDDDEDENEAPHELYALVHERTFLKLLPSLDS